MKRKGKRFSNKWIDDYIEKPYKQLDEASVNIIKNDFRKHKQIYSVMRFINYETLRIAFHSMTLITTDEGNICKSNKERATGIDRMTKKEYGEHLDKNLRNLLNKLRKHTYKMKTVLRTYIPKAPKVKIIDGNEVIVIDKRPLSIPCIEDSILQVAIVNQILETLTEEIFTDESYGYRPNKNVRKAIDYIEEINYRYDIKYILVLDNKAYFDSINRDKLIEMVRDIIKDKVFIGILKTILKTGYLDKEDKKIKYPKKGIYQGMNISPVLANLYLHNVIDSWYQTIETKEKISMVRYADDIIMLGRNKEDMYTVLEAIKERFIQYELEIAEEKSRLIDLEEEDVTYLGYRIHKDGREIQKYISDKKLREIRMKIDNIISDSLNDLQDVEVAKRVQSRDDYKLYHQDYIRYLNNYLVGIYRTYKDTNDPLKLDQIYDYAYMGISRQWSNRLSKEELEEMIFHIEKPKII